jgi:hypothetical protein
VSEVAFIGFVISPHGIALESERISLIENWPIPESVQDLQLLVGLTKIYLWFVRKHATVRLLITDLLNNAEFFKISKQVKWKSTRDVELTLLKLTRTFTDVPILKHFQPAKPLVLQIDSRGFAIAGIVSKYEGFGILGLVTI